MSIQLLREIEIHMLSFPGGVDGQGLALLRRAIVQFERQGDYAGALKNFITRNLLRLMPPEQEEARELLREVPQLIPSGSELYTKWKADQGAAAVGSGARGNANDGGPATRQPPTLADDVKDAARYRHIRDGFYYAGNGVGLGYVLGVEVAEDATREQLLAAVDAAIDARAVCGHEWYDGTVCLKCHELADQRDADDAMSALHTLYTETADYITLNKLGPVHHNQSMKNARDVLKTAGYTTWYDGPASNELPTAEQVQSWTSPAESLPACPHCHRGISPSDDFGGHRVNKEIELRRRQVDQKKGTEGT